MSAQFPPLLGNPHASTRRRNLWCLTLLLAAIVAVVYFPVVRTSFLEIDDNRYVYNNKHITAGLTPHNIAWAGVMIFGDWTPLFWLTLECCGTLTNLIFGPMKEQITAFDALPPATVFHATSLAFHVAGSSLLFLVIEKLTKRLWPSFLVVLLWSLHPLRVESVTWTTELKDLQAGFFGFAAIYCYLLWLDRRKGAFGACVIALSLSLLTKPTFLVLPLLLLLIDFWPLNRLRSWFDLLRLSREKWPLFALGAARLAVSDHFIRGISVPDLGWPLQMTNALYAFVRALQFQADFRALTIYYPVVNLTISHALLAIFLLLAATSFCYWQRSRRPWLLMGWLWFLVTLTPVAGFVQIFHHRQAFADRFTYLPSIGLLIMLLFSIPPAWFERRIKRAGLLAAGAIAAATLIYFTTIQLSYWKDTQTLFARNIALFPHDAFSRLALANANIRQRHLDNALEQFRQMTLLEPSDTLGYRGMAYVHYLNDQSDAALPLARRAVELDDRNPDLHTLLAAILEKDARLQEALSELERAAALSPKDPSAQRNLQSMRARLGLPPPDNPPPDNPLPPYPLPPRLPHPQPHQ
jgi:tetratricopeptide (TPR) repeat protein